MYGRIPPRGEEETGYLSDRFAGRPRLLSVDSKPNAVAMVACQSSVPNGYRQFSHAPKADLRPTQSSAHPHSPPPGDLCPLPRNRLTKRKHIQYPGWFKCGLVHAQGQSTDERRIGDAMQSVVQIGGSDQSRLSTR